MIHVCHKCHTELIPGKNWRVYLVNKPYYICISCLSKNAKVNRERNKENIKIQKKKYYDKNKEAINSKKRVSNLSFEEIEKKRLKNKIYREVTNSAINARRRKRKKERFLNDSSYRIRESFGSYFRFL